MSGASERQRMGVVLLAIGLVAFPAPSRAQTSPQTAAPAPTLTAAWQNGFFIQSSDGMFRLQVGALAHVDGRFPLEEDGDDQLSTFLVRRVRPYLRGRIAERFEFFVNPDFAGGTLVVQDAYLDTLFSPAFRLRIGKAKTPFGSERLQPVANILFMERALPTVVAPNRDAGIQVLGDLAGGAISYQAGIVNGAPDGLSVDIDTSDDKDLVGRVVTRPFLARKDSLLAGLGGAFAMTRGRQQGSATLLAYRTGVIGQTFFSYVAGALADGVRTRYSPYVFYYRGPFGAFGEYAHSEVPVRLGDSRALVQHGAWAVTGSYVLTGEQAQEGGVLRPRRNFNFGHGDWGAFQVAFRVHGLDTDRSAFEEGLVAPGSSRTTHAWAAVLNWYLNPYVRYVFHFERFAFDQDTAGRRPAERLLAFRTQLSF
jgi:phosphate-selective porin OprO/OprP